MSEDNREISEQKADPSLLTTQQLLLAISNLKEVVFTRLDGMDKAVIQFNEAITRTPTDVDKQIRHLKELHEEKFHSIETQFKERDTRTEQTAKDSKVAVDAALQAAKEAVGEQNKSSALAISKSEASTIKQIDQIQTLISTSNKGLEDKITDLKERVSRKESNEVGHIEEKGDRDNTDKKGQSMDSFYLSMFATFLSLIGIIIVLVRTFTGH